MSLSHFFCTFFGMFLKQWNEYLHLSTYLFPSHSHTSYSLQKNGSSYRSTFSLTVIFIFLCEYTIISLTTSFLLYYNFKYVWCIMKIIITLIFFLFFFHAYTEDFRLKGLLRRSIWFSRNLFLLYNKIH